MKYYIIHNDALVERRTALQSQLDNFGISGDSVEWVTSFPITDPLVDRIKKFTNSLMPIEHVSCSLKHYDALSRMIRDDIEEAIVFEDDVVISDYFDQEAIRSINYGYIKLGRGPNDCQVALGSQLCIHPNPGGSESYYVKKEFANEFIKNITVGWGLDVEQYAFIKSVGMQLMCLPVCYQEFKLSFEYPHIEFPITWIEYIREYVYGRLKRYTFEQILKV